MGRKHCGKRRKCCLPAFSSFPSMFSFALFLGVINSLPNDKILDWSKLKTFADNICLMIGLKTLWEWPAFLLFPQCILPFSEQILFFSVTFILSSANALNLNLCRILLFGTELTHYQTTNFRLFQTKKFADDNFKFDKNDRRLSKLVEKTVEKGEIARDQQFLLFPQCFQKACFPGASKGVIVWEWVK